MQVCNIHVVEYMIADILDDSRYIYDMHIFGELSLLLYFPMILPPHFLGRQRTFFSRCM